MEDTENRRDEDETDDGNISPGKALTLDNGVGMNVTDHLQVDGTVTADNLTNNGTVNVTSSNTLHLRGSLTGRGVLTVTSTGRVIIDGTLNPSSANTVLQRGATVLARNFGPNAIPAS